MDKGKPATRQDPARQLVKLHKRLKRLRIVMIVGKTATLLLMAVWGYGFVYHMASLRQTGLGDLLAGGIPVLLVMFCLFVYELPSRYEKGGVCFLPSWWRTPSGRLGGAPARPRPGWRKKLRISATGSASHSDRAYSAHTAGAKGQGLHPGTRPVAPRPPAWYTAHKTAMECEEEWKEETQPATAKPKTGWPSCKGGMPACGWRWWRAGFAALLLAVVWLGGMAYSISLIGQAEIPLWAQYWQAFSFGGAIVTELLVVLFVYSRLCRTLKGYSSVFVYLVKKPAKKWRR